MSFKKIILGIIIFILLIVSTLLVLPFFFKDKILQVAKSEINKNIDARVDFKDVDISFFKSFPLLRADLQDVSVVGVKEFDSIPLLSAKSLGVALEVMPLLKSMSNINIKGIYAESPTVNILVRSDGKANYDITKPDTTTSEPASEFKINLEKYKISNANITYKDNSSKNEVIVKGLNHKGSGEFSSTVYDLDTKTNIDSLSYFSGNMKYLSKAKVDLDAIFNIDMALSKYSLKQNKLKINDLEINADGFVQMIGSIIAMDLKLKSPQTDFKSLFSIIPGAYTSDYSNVKSSGSFDFKADIKGKYDGAKGRYPSFAINSLIKDGFIQYPSMPLNISGLNTNISASLPDGNNMDLLKIDVPHFKLKLGNNPLEGMFQLRTPISDPDINSKVKGNINLADVLKIMPMDGVTALSGLINADVVMKARMSQLEKGDYENVQMSGVASAQNIIYAAQGMPKVNITQAKMSFSPQRVDIPTLIGIIGKSDINVVGNIDNILAYFSPNKTMKGKIVFRSNNFDANEWLAEDTNAQNTKAAQASTPATKPFDRFQFDVDAKINQLKYDNYPLKQLVVDGSITSNEARFNEGSVIIGNSDVKVNGKIENIFNYLYNNETLTGDIKMNSQFMDLNQFMTEQPSTVTNTATEPILVPKNMKINVIANLGKVLYTNMVLNNLQGVLNVENQVVKLNNCSSNFLDGRINLDGNYNTQNEQKPTYNMDLNLEQMDFAKSFETFNSIKQIAPIIKFVQGKFSTSMKMGGALNKDLTPDLNTLTLDGFLHTLNAVIKNAKPIQEFANKLNVDYLNNLEIKDTKNWLTVKNGKVEVKPFDLKVKDIAMRIGGQHSITNEDMSYTWFAKVPRKLLESNAVGAAAGQGYNWIRGEASKYGINVSNSEFVNVECLITGSMQSPKLKFKFLNGEGNSVNTQTTALINDTKQKAIDSLKTVANKKLDEAKAKANQAAQKAIDSLKNVATRKTEEAVEKAKEKVGDAVSKEVKDKIGNEATKKVEDAIGTKGKDELEKARKKLEQFDPFKKKKN